MMYYLPYEFVINNKYYCYYQHIKSRKTMSKCEQSPEKIKALNQVTPCRGCLIDCIYISKCEGKLWRISDATLLALLEESKTDN